MRIRALVTRILQQLRRDKRTMALLFFAPLLVLSLMYFIFGSDDPDIDVVATGAPAEMIQQLDGDHLKIHDRNAYSTNQLKKDEYAAWIDFNKKELHLLNDSPTLSNQLNAALNQSQHSETPQLKAIYVYGDKNTTIFDTFSPMLIGFFVFFFVFLIAGIALLKERTSGTLERLQATPIKPFEIISGYMIGYGIFAVIQTILIVLFSVYVLDIVSNGSIWLALLICLIVAIVALSLGTFLSSFAHSEFQMVQFIPLVIIPQIFFSGLFPLDSTADWLQNIGKVMPLYYAADSLNSVMYKGLGFSEIATNLGILLLFATVFLTLNLISLRKGRNR